MGYCSKVALALTDKALKEFNSMYEKLSKPDFINPLSNRDRCKHYVNKDKVHLFVLDWTKWDDDFPDIFLIANFMDSLEDNDRDDEFLFKRMGEEDGDLEERGGLEIELYITRDFDITDDFIPV